MKIKDKTRKAIVEAYQKQTQEAIDRIKSLNEKMSTSKKAYLEALEGNIERAPYWLGYLFWPLDQKKNKS